MSTITTIQSSDLITNSRADINTNFGNLNTDKIETSTLDTDTTLAANSDTKIATQKAVKAYVDSGGNPNASETARGIVQEATDAQVTAGTATGSTGAKLVITPAKLATRLPTVLAGYQLANVFKSGITTYDLSTASGVQNITHGVGKVPLKVNLKAVIFRGADYYDSNFGTFDSSGNRCIAILTGDSSPSGAVYTSTTYGLGFSNSAAENPFDGFNDETHAVISVDATNIILTWTKKDSPTGTITIMWEAIA